MIFTSCFAVFSFGQTPTPTPSEESRNGTGANNGTGTGGPPPPSPRVASGELTALRILSKPRATYTQEARENVIQGTVRLRITFDASGKIGAISPVSGLPNGLTEQAIAAAKQIKFEPAKRDGVPYSVVKTIDYNFVDYQGYYHETDKLIEKTAEILEMPVPKLSPEEIKDSGGRIKVSVLLDPQNGAGLFKPSSAWSKELTQKIREAVVKIKFNSAIGKSKATVTQLKEIEYVFPE